MWYMRSFKLTVLCKRTHISHSIDILSNASIRPKERSHCGIKPLQVKIQSYNFIEVFCLHSTKWLLPSPSHCFILCLKFQGALHLNTPYQTANDNFVRTKKRRMSFNKTATYHSRHPADKEWASHPWGLWCCHFKQNLDYLPSLERGR